MEVLNRRNRGPNDPKNASIGVSMDPKLSLSFQLPVSYRQKLSRASEAGQIQQSNVHGGDGSITTLPYPAAAANAPADSSSWEEMDWETLQHPIQPVASSAQEANQEVDGQHASESQPQAITPPKRVVGLDNQWEEFDNDAQDQSERNLHDLPDDFPVLIVNLTQLRHEHFAQEPMDTQDQIREIYRLVKQTIHEHFSTIIDALFEQKMCFHCSYGTSRSLLQNLHKVFPDDLLALIDYPTEIDQVPLHELLFTLTRPSPWRSVNYLKDCLRQSSRDLKWKAEVVEEVEKLAEQEHDRRTKQQQELSDEIDQLTTLRDSFKTRLESVKTHQQYMLLRQLEQVENRLTQLVDQYLEEPELSRQEREVQNLTIKSNSSRHQLTVLDMVILMTFDRLPRDLSISKEQQLNQLEETHVHLRSLWKRDFGRLPYREPEEGEEGVVTEATVEQKSLERVDEGAEPEVESMNGDEHEPQAAVVCESWEQQEEDSDVVDVSQQMEKCAVFEDDKNTKQDAKVLEEQLEDGYGADEEEQDSDDDAAETKAKPQPKVSKAPRRVKRRSKKSKSSSKSKSSASAESNFQPFACVRAVGLLQQAKDQEYDGGFLF